jgi:uncharacterized membrane protein required for colicin V production
MEPWLLPSLCATVLLLTLAGCSYGPDRIETKPKAPDPRTPQQIGDDVTKAAGDLETAIRSIRDAKTAEAGTQKVKDAYDHMKSLVTDWMIPSLKNAIPAERQQFMERYQGNADRAQRTLAEALADLGKVRGLPGKFSESTKSVVKDEQDLMKEIQQAAASTEDPPNMPEIPPEPPPDTSCWAVWMLCLIVLGACVGFLFRDGLWGNAVRLVNVVFAGLLAMNFYDWLAKYMTNYSADIHSYVSLFDFLALWIGFIFFMVVFRSLTEVVSRVRVRFLKIVDQVGGTVLSLCIGWVMVGFVLTTLHAAPLAQYPLFGCFQPQSNMFFGMLAPDRQWLGFTKYESSGPFCRVADQDYSFPPDSVDHRNFIEEHLKRRMHVEHYSLATQGAILVNKDHMKGNTPPPPPAK